MEQSYCQKESRSRNSNHHNALLGVLVGVLMALITVLKMPAVLLASSNVTAGLALYISMGKTIIGFPLEYSFIGLKKITLQVCHLRITDLLIYSRVYCIEIYRDTDVRYMLQEV